MATDPPARADGRCARPGCRAKLAFKKRRGLEHLYDDPFCSTECCKAYHGVTMMSRASSKGDSATIEEHLGEEALAR